MQEETVPALGQDTTKPGAAAMGMAAPDTTASVRVALLTDGSPAVSDAVQAAYQSLAAAGHAVAVLPLTNSQEAWADTSPTVALLYSGAGPEAVAQVCAELKSACAGQPVVIGAVLPPGAGSREADAAIRRDLRMAGAADVLTWHGSTEELEAHIDLLSQILTLQLVLAGAREELAGAARLDSATRLLNRRSFFRAAHRECSRARRYRHPLACLMIGIDYFEHFNKTFGDACGDYLLSTIAGAISESIRDTDIAGRFSDKKMVVLLPETDISGATNTREKMKQAIADTRFVWQGQQLPVSISSGEAERRWDWVGSDAEAGSTASEDEEDTAVPVRLELAELLEEADAALAVACKGAHCPDIFIEDDLPALDPARTEF